MNLLLKSAAVLTAAVAFASCQSASTTSVQTDADIEKKVEMYLSQMTLEEKVKVIHAQSKFSSAGVPRLGIPELWTTDGPHGVRPEVLWDEWDQAGWTNDSCVAYPALTCLAATWNTDMAALYGKSIGEEALYRGKDVLLGPGVNIYRTPLNGRNFEYMGEDPFLASEMVVPYVVELQKNGVAACVKHYALNNQESNRHGYNVNVDDRALYEIYLPAFKAAVQRGKAWSIMGSYNLYKGQHVCHNQYLLNDILKRDWGFDGAVISDWGGTHDTDQAITNGLDLEFGTWTDGLHYSEITNAYDKYYLAAPYLAKLRSGEASMDVLNDKVRRVLRLMLRTSMNPNKGTGSMCSEEHYAAARQIAGEGIVLLKNAGRALPFGADVKKIAVIGENAVKMMTVGGGSSSLKAQHETTPLEGITKAVGEDIEVVFERGYVGDVTGNYNGVSTGQDLSESRDSEQLIADAVKLASESDAVVFVGGLNKSVNQDCEGQDRLEYALPYEQDKVIEALAAVNPRLAVVVISGNGVAMPWVEKVPAVLMGWFSGSETGNALADVLFGKVNPSGKLPFTMPVKLEDNGAHALGSYSPTDSEIYYKESILVGYRWAEKKEIAPLFAFGHGLSYTTFEYSDFKCGESMTENGKLELSLKVTNTGDMDGKEIVQMYVGDDECSLLRPVKELKGFDKVSLKAGESAVVKFTVTPDMLKFYDDKAGEWRSEKGDFTVYVGAASDDIRCQSKFTLK